MKIVSGFPAADVHNTATFLLHLVATDLVFCTEY
jgi:hypothetical protein